MTLRFLSALVCLLLLVGCDSVETGPLSPGEFRATASGAVEGQYDGDASFNDEETPFETLLELQLTASEARVPGRTYTIPTGVFLNLSWERQPGTFTLSTLLGSEAGTVSLASARTFGFPVPYRVVSGSVTVTLASADRVEGTFDVVAEDPTVLEGDAPTVRVQGAFVAIPDSE